MCVCVCVVNPFLLIFKPSVAIKYLTKIFAFQQKQNILTKIKANKKKKKKKQN